MNLFLPVVLLIMNEENRLKYPLRGTTYLSKGMIYGIEDPVHTFDLKTFFLDAFGRVWTTLVKSIAHKIPKTWFQILTLFHVRCLAFFFFLRKITPELTSAANPPLFAEEDWP